MRNLEAKFRLDDLERARAAAQALGYVPAGSFEQRDTFFNVARGKLKLREQPPEAWLIHYRRERESGLMLSRYEITPMPEAGRARAMLASALGAIAEVRKHRTLLVRQNVRLHLDRVDTLGSFGEIEAVLTAADARGSPPDDTIAAIAAAASAARVAVDRLLRALGVREDELIDVSYFELMPRRQE